MFFFRLCLLKNISLINFVTTLATLKETEKLVDAVEKVRVGGFQISPVHYCIALQLQGFARNEKIHKGHVCFEKPGLGYLTDPV